MSRPIPPGPAREEPEWWRRARALRRLPVIVVIVVAIIIVRASAGSRPPPLRTSCTTPAFALSTYSTRDHHSVQWAVTGPARSRFALTIGASELRRTSTGGVQPVAEPGFAARQPLLAGPERIGSNCTAHGSFGIVLPTARYSVKLWLLPSGSGTTEAATKTLSITP